MLEIAKFLKYNEVLLRTLWETIARNTDSRFLPACHDAVRAISGLGRSENALHSAAVATVLILLFLRLAGRIRIFWRLAQGWAGQTDAPGNAVDPGFKHDPPLVDIGNCIQAIYLLLGRFCVLLN